MTTCQQMQPEFFSREKLLHSLEPLMTQMEHWSILSNILNYIQYDKDPKNYHNLNIDAVNKYKNSLDRVELDFGVMPEILWEEYLDVYEGIQ